MSDDEQDTADQSSADKQSGGNDQSADKQDNGDDEVIQVAQTPTSTALLTQLEHNRLDAEARGLGAGHTGSAVFHMQRLTAVALIPLTVWFVVGVLRMATATRAQAAAWLSEPIHAVLMAIFIVIGLRHAVIGMRIVFEDYVRGEPWHSVCVLTTQAIAVFIATASLAALIHLAL